MFINFKKKSKNNRTQTSQNLHFFIDGKKFEFELIYKKRKTFTIKIDSSGCIKILAPTFLKNSEVVKLVEQKAAWISRKSAELKNKKTVEKKFVNDEEFLFLGQKYSLEIIETQLFDDVKLSENKFFLYATHEKSEEILKNWYKQKAGEIIFNRIEYYKKILNVEPNLIKIKDQKTRWGSCNFKKNLNFNWRIIMAPLELVDYLVVHELSHLLHLNHSQNFWNTVAEVLPDYKNRRLHLKKIGHLLAWK